MTASVNKVVLVGNLGKDPETKPHYRPAARLPICASTEVVLQGFNSALTLLDPRPDGTNPDAAGQDAREAARYYGDEIPF
jgi:hypothetical protein